MKIFYFTSTGNSLDLAKRFDAELFSIPQLLHTNNLAFEDDKIGFIFPTYAASTPCLVMEFIKRASLKANYFFAITTNGGSTAGCLTQFCNVAAENQIAINYSTSLATIDNYLRFFEMGKQLKNSNLAEIEYNIARIVSDISNNTTKRPNTTCFITKISEIAYAGFNKFGKDVTKSYTISKACTLCGTCAKVCPTKNINVSATVNFEERCVGCFGCTHNCPTNAIRFTGEKSRKRYRNANVTLNELISSNNLL